MSTSNNKTYYQENKEMIKKKAKEYYNNNKNKVLARVKARATEPEVILKARKYRVTYKKKNPHLEADRRLRVRYSITTDGYNKLFLSQKGYCKICDIHQSVLKKKLCVDHCHITGIIRGLLCDRCNLAIGNLNDDLTLVLKAANYLKETQ